MKPNTRREAVAEAPAPDAEGAYALHLPTDVADSLQNLLRDPTTVVRLVRRSGAAVGYCVSDSAWSLVKVLVKAITDKDNELLATIMNGGADHDASKDVPLDKVFGPRRR